MGRQVVFRATDADLREMEAAFRSLGATFLGYYHSTSQATAVSSFDRATVRDPIIWLVRSSDVPTLPLKHIPTQGHWLIDGLTAPAVELSRGSDPNASGESLGRLYYSTGCSDETGAKREAAPGFNDWAATLLAYVRKTFVRNAALSAYDGPHLRHVDT